MPAYSSGYNSDEVVERSQFRDRAGSQYPAYIFQVEIYRQEVTLAVIKEGDNVGQTFLDGKAPIRPLGFFHATPSQAIEIGTTLVKYANRLLEEQQEHMKELAKQGPPPKRERWPGDRGDR